MIYLQMIDCADEELYTRMKLNLPSEFLPVLFEYARKFGESLDDHFTVGLMNMFRIMKFFLDSDIE